MSLSIKVLNDGLSRILRRSFKNGRAVWRWVTGAVSESDTVFEESPLIPEELVEIINARFYSDRKAQISAVFGESDFLPFSFLERGIKRGTAVCRLVRWYGGTLKRGSDIGFVADSFEDAGLLQLIQTINENEASRTASGLPALKDADLVSILSIKQDQAAAFFEGSQDNPISALKPEKLKNLMPIPIGTGFLVGRNFLLTNHHILRSPEEAKEFAAEFGYEQDMFGRITLPVQYALDPSCFFTNSQLDYTLIKLKRNPVFGEAGDVFGFLPMMEDPKSIAPPLTPAQAKALEMTSSIPLRPEISERINRPNLLGETPGLPGEPVNIIQHPKGQPKQIVLSSNRVQQLTKDFLRYEADADFSSSGSPVLNQQWQLVALHHASLADDKFNILGQEGVRISSIVADLDRKNWQLEGGQTELERAAGILESIVQDLPLLERMRTIGKRFDSDDDKELSTNVQKNERIFNADVKRILKEEFADIHADRKNLQAIRARLLDEAEKIVNQAKAGLNQSEEAVNLDSSTIAILTSEPGDRSLLTQTDEPDDRVLLAHAERLRSEALVLRRRLDNLREFFQVVVREDDEEAFLMAW